MSVNFELPLEIITILSKSILFPCLLMDQNEMSIFYRGPSIDASYQVSYHLAKRLQRKSLGIAHSVLIR
jgi:hypothetical protein